MHEEDLELESFGEPSWLTDAEDIDAIEAPAWLEASTVAAGEHAEAQHREVEAEEPEDAFFLASEAVADLATMENAVRRADGVTVVAEPAQPDCLADEEFPEEPEWTEAAAQLETSAQAAQQADAALQSIVDEIDAQMTHQSSVFSTDFESQSEAVTTQHVVFYLGSTRYALPIEAVIEVSTVPRITTLPGIPHYVRGVANLRGEILPVLDMRGLLGLPRFSNTVLERMLVVRFAEQDAVAGFVVDRIRGLARLDKARVTHPQGLVEDAVVRFLEGVTEHENEVLNLLNARKIFLSEEVRRLAGG
jgi:chemotaxis signal transduction protein